MSVTQPTDEAYIVAYKRDRIDQRALIIAPNPFQAKQKLLDYFEEREITGVPPRSLHIKGVLRDNVSEAQETGVALL